MTDDKHGLSKLDLISIIGGLITHAEILQKNMDGTYEKLEGIVSDLPQTLNHHMTDVAEKSDKLFDKKAIVYTMAGTAICAIFALAILYVLTSWQRHAYATLEEKTAQLEVKKADLQASINSMESKITSLSKLGGTLSFKNCEHKPKDGPVVILPCVHIDKRWPEVQGPNNQAYIVPVVE